MKEYQNLIDSMKTKMIHGFEVFYNLIFINFFYAIYSFNMQTANVNIITLSAAHKAYVYLLRQIGVYIERWLNENSKNMVAFF